MSGVRMLHFLKDLWKFFEIDQYYMGTYRKAESNTVAYLHH